MHQGESSCRQRAGDRPTSKPSYRRRSPMWSDVALRPFVKRRREALRFGAVAALSASMVARLGYESGQCDRRRDPHLPAPRLPADRDTPHPSLERDDPCR